MATISQVNNFISKLSSLAVAEAKKRSKWVLPSVCIAQAALETGWGTSPLMTKANAYFGIKATGWTGKVFNSATLECYDGKTYENVNACFRALKTVAQTAVAIIGTTALITDVNWAVVGSAAALAGVLSLLTSLAGIPEEEA